MLRNLEANPIGSPLSVQRATYNRDDTGTRVDVMARASSSPTQGAPKLTIGGAAVAPVLMDGPTALGDWYAQGVPFPAGSLPGNITVTNSGDVPPTSITTHATDEVFVRSAVYDSLATTITVVASSSDKGSTGAGIAPPTLSLSGFPTAVPVSTGNAADRAEVTFTATGVIIPPAFVRVASSAGGQGQAEVTMGASARIYAPGVAWVADDIADVIQNDPIAIPIDVLANDVQGGLAWDLASLTVLAPGANIGRGDGDGRADLLPRSLGHRHRDVPLHHRERGGHLQRRHRHRERPPESGRSGSHRGERSVGGAINVTSGGSVVVNVVANDSANGGTLDAASVVISTPPTSGTAVANGNGTVTYTAAGAGTVTFQYTVANLPLVVGRPGPALGPGHGDGDRRHRREPDPRSASVRPRPVAGARHEQRLGRQHHHDLPRRDRGWDRTGHRHRSGGAGRLPVPGQRHLLVSDQHPVLARHEDPEPRGPGPQLT